MRKLSSARSAPTNVASRLASWQRKLTSFSCMWRSGVLGGSESGSQSYASLCFSRTRLHYARCTLQRCLVQLPIGHVLCKESSLRPVCGNVISSSCTLITVQLGDLLTFVMAMTPLAIDAHHCRSIVLHTDPVVFHVLVKLAVVQACFTLGAAHQRLKIEESLFVCRAFF